jgi:hypothetical protein
LQSPNFELLSKIVEVFFLAELLLLHLALIIVFVAWLAKHVLHELSGLRAEIRRWREESTRRNPIEGPAP